jgi:hypothetical protein
MYKARYEKSSPTPAAIFSPKTSFPKKEFPFANIAKGKFNQYSMPALPRLIMVHNYS